MPEDKRNSPVNAGIFANVPAFVQGLAFADLPADVVAQARRCLLDLIGVATAGNRTRAAQIVNNYAATQLRSSETEARMLFDGRRASPAGAAFAGAATIDSFDAHDGHVLIKGHAGVVVLPTLLAMVDSGAACGDREFITALVLGYEVATRAGIALHASAVEPHCSGTWNAIACAAIGARLLGLGNGQIRHALGIAEYFGPRGQLARICDSPSLAGPVTAGFARTTQPQQSAIAQIADIGLRRGQPTPRALSLNRFANRGPESFPPPFAVNATAGFSTGL